LGKEEMIGKITSHYKIGEKLGGGGMGVVYKAEDTKLKRTVALKFLPPTLSADPAAKDRFIHEAQAASALDHPNICTIHEIGETDDGQSYIAMACYEGESLKDLIVRARRAVPLRETPLPMPIDEAITIVIQIAKGLARAHEAGIVHRDIKPANIMITDRDEVKILDFGLAKLAGQTRLTRTGTMVGTVAYMSPEQAKGDEIDHRTDIWSLGVVMYEILSGKLPFGGEYEQAIVYSIINEEPATISSINEDISPELETIITKSLSKNPNDRYQTIDDLLADFKKFSKEVDISFDESLPKLLNRVWRKKSVKRITAAAAAILLLTAAILSFWPKMVDLPTIAVIPFENQTGDISNDIHCKSIASLLITSLEQSAHFHVTSRERLYDLKKQLGKEDVEFPDSELGFELCRMDGVTSLIVGSLVRMGEIFTTDLKVLDVESKDIIKTARSDGRGLESIINKQIDELIQEVVTGVGDISEEKFSETHRPIKDVTTTSMEAYNYFLKGREEYHKYHYNEAVKFLEKAVELDTTFAMAYCYLGINYYQISDFQSQVKAFKKAKTYADKVTEKEKLIIEDYEADYTEYHSEKSFRIVKQLVKKYPKEARFHSRLAGKLSGRNQIDEAIAEYKIAISLDPYRGGVYNALAYIYLREFEDYDQALMYAKKYAQVSPGEANPHDTMGDIYYLIGDLDQAIVKYEEALFIKPDFLRSGIRLAHAYALQENYGQTMKNIDDFIDIKRGVFKSYGYYCRGFYHAWLGCFRQSVQDIKEAIKIDDAHGKLGHIIVDTWLMACHYYESGNLELSRQSYNNYLDLAKEHEEDSSLFKLDSAIFIFRSLYNFGQGMLDLKENKVNSAKSRLSEMESNLPNIPNEFNSKGVNIFYQTLKAEISLVENDVEKAIAVYKKVSPVGYPWNRLYYHIPFTRDIIARAYIQKGEIDKAIAAYERLITFDPKSKDRHLIHPKYHYRLAKLYQDTDQYNKAITEYEKFLDIWKNADKDQPDLIDAKKRLADLKQSAQSPK
jgi:serine/threonine protein kinase/tetratricopeptide (TPR) repeat protein